MVKGEMDHSVDDTMNQKKGEVEKLVQTDQEPQSQDYIQGEVGIDQGLPVKVR